MSKSFWDRLAALGGVLFVVLFAIGMLLPGEPPMVDDSADTVVGFFTDNRSAIMAGGFLIGLGVIAFIWFMSSIVEAMRRAGEERLATAALAGFLLTVGLGATAALTRVALAYSIAGEADSGTVLALFHVAALIEVMSSIFFGATCLAIGGAALRTGFLPSTWGWVSTAVGLLFVVSASALARDGFWSPTGAILWIVNIVFVVWLVVTSVLHYREVAKA